MMKERGSGILLHITSLPSPYGIGDLGPGAYAFADFLSQAKQRFWQILPINPIDPVYGNSPYHCISAFASNLYLISPDLMVQDGLLSRKDLQPLPAFPPIPLITVKQLAIKPNFLTKHSNVSKQV